MAARNDYVIIAAALARTRPDIETFTKHSAIGDNTFVDGISYKAASDAWRETRDAVAVTLAADNHAFDLVRFVRATEA